MSSRQPRKAKLTNIDYAVLFSGQQIPEFSSESDYSDGDFGTSKGQRKKRRLTTLKNKPIKTVSKGICFVCQRKSTKIPIGQCEICSRWYHDKCGRRSDVLSALGNSSCHECLQESIVEQRSTLPRRPIESITDVVNVLQQAKKIVVIVGAGISVSCGIPDFRSKDGIYELVKHMDVALPEPECLFHIDYFREDPSPFFQMVQNVFAHSPSPSITHRFLRLLQDQRKLLRVYSQNVDGLEETAGVTKLISCHGTFAWSACMKCRTRVRTTSILPAIQAGVIPTCSAMQCCGVLKPEITFFGELLSDSVSTSITKDRLQADLLLVIGTSLKVSPVAEIPNFLPTHIPQIVINKTPLKKKKMKTKRIKNGSTSVIPLPFDIQLLGDSDTIVQELCNSAGWTLSGDVKQEKRTLKHTKQEMVHHPALKRICIGKCECAEAPDGQMGIGAEETGESVESVVCDGCGDPIGCAGALTRSAVYRCKYVVCHSEKSGNADMLNDSECFDFDLCSECYSHTKRKHYKGHHTFTKSVL